MRPSGSLYYTENDAIRRIDSDGRVSTVAQNVSPSKCASVQGIERRDQPLLRGLAVDGAGTVYVAATGCASSADPDGTRLAFSALTKSGWEIMMYSLELNRMISFPHMSGTNLSPAWSGDGTKLAFSSSRSGEP